MRRISRSWSTWKGLDQWWFGKASLSTLVWKILTYLLTYVRTYAYTPRGWVLFWEANWLSAGQKFPEFYGTRRFIVAFTRARHLSLFWARSIQSVYFTSQLLKIHLFIILTSTARSSRWSFTLSFPTKTLYTHLLFLIRATGPADLILLYLLRILLHIFVNYKGKKQCLRYSKQCVQT